MKIEPLHFRETHRFSGKLWMASGILCMLCGLFGKSMAALVVYIISIMAAAIISILYMKSKGAGNKAHLQPVTHFLVHIGIGIARVVFQRADTKFRYVTLVVLQDRAHGGCVAVCRCGNDRERQQIFRLPIRWKAGCRLHHRT